MAKRFVIFIWCSFWCAVLGLWIAGRPAYRHYKESRALNQARKFIALGDLRNASLSARTALMANPRSVGACQIMAKLAELLSSPQALDWRRRIVDLSPSVEARLDLAAAALRVQRPPYPLASEILEALSGTASNYMGYCNLSADLALKLGKRQEAEGWFDAARRLEPTNELHRLNLAVLRLNSTNTALAAEARATLNGLRASTNLSALALRWLIVDNLTGKNLLSAKALSRELLADRQADFGDQLRHLEILQAEDLPEFGRFLITVQQRASTNASEIYDLSAFMIRHGLAAQARKWLTNCPWPIQGQQPVPLAKVECFLALADWAGLENFLKDKRWGVFEPMRLAFLSRAAFESRDTMGSDVRWRLAVSLAHRRLGSLMWLATKAQEWGRAEAKVDVLREIVQQFPTERWALRTLGEYYLATGNTRALNDVYGRMASTTPDDFAARNNFATTALLLRTNLARAHETARQLYAEHLRDPIIVSTYAYSLHVQGHTAEGLAALETLDENELALPTLALYYGVLLRANGQTAKAREYLTLAQRAALLPEERALLNSSL